MPIWAAQTIQNFVEDGESLIATEVKCIIARVALDIVSGTPITHFQ